VSDLPIGITFWFWVVLEVGLRTRDRVRGKGTTGSDRGTRMFIGITIIGATVVAQVAATTLRGHTSLRLGSGTGGWQVSAGLVMMWLGLAVRIWAVVVLGGAFRTTVEVDPDQQLVDWGPYRWIRHPSYTGLVLASAGFGLALGNWLSLAVALLVPLGGLARRIQVEEQVLVFSMGPSYAAYRKRTKRLIPGIW